MKAFTITEDTITLFIDGELFQVPRTAPQANLVLDGIREDVPEAELRARCVPKSAVQAFSGGRVLVCDGEVTLDGHPVPKCIESTIVALMRDGLPFEYLINFMARLSANVSNRAVEELYRFLEHEGMPITKDGHFLAYKGVGEDRFSAYGNKETRVLQGRVDEGGHIYNGDGCTIEVLRQDVDDNCNRTCSHGLHVGSHAYASSWSSVEIVVEVDPADVVSIPSDCNGQKARVCKYRVVGACHGLMSDSACSAFSPYAAMPSRYAEDPDDVEISFTQDDIDEARSSGYDDGQEAGFGEGLDEARERLAE
jgi:hypothetical protein